MNRQQHPPLVEQASTRQARPSDVGGRSPALLEVGPEVTPDIHPENGGSYPNPGDLIVTHIPGNIPPLVAFMFPNTARALKPIRNDRVPSAGINSDVTHTSDPAPKAHVKPCPYCSKFQPTGVRLCRSCGYEFYPARKSARIPKHMRSR